MAPMLTTRAGGRTTIEGENLGDNEERRENEGRSDRDFKGDPMVSGVQAFAYSLLKKDTVSGKETERQVNHFSATKMITEKRNQRKDQFRASSQGLHKTES